MHISFKTLFCVTNLQHSLAQMAIVGASFYLAGCSTVTEERSAQDHRTIAARTELANSQLRQDNKLQGVVIQEEIPRFARRSIPLDRSRMLPASAGLLTLQLPGKHNLRTVAAHIERLTKIPVVLSPDVLIPASEFAPASLISKFNKSASPTSQNQQEQANYSTKLTAQLVEQAGAQRQWEPMDLGPDLIEINHRGTLANLLDLIATQGQFQWMYEDGYIRFYRLMTRVIAVRALPSIVSQSGSLTLPAGSGNMSVTNSSETNFWAGIEKGVRDMISSSGKISLDPSLGIITVNDTLSNINAIERYMDGVNRQLSRQVRLTVEVLQVSLNAENQAGIDWSYVTSSSKLGNLNLLSAPAITSNTGGISLVKTASDGTDNAIFIRALERFGRVSSSYSSVINTMNKQPVPLGSVSTQSYLKQVTPTVSTSTTGASTYSAPALTPGEITTGFSINLLPIILDSNQVMMQCTISISSLKEMVTFTTGSGSAQQSVQQPNVASFATQQRMTVKSGDTIVLSGFESESTETRESDVVRQTLPGTRTNTRNKNTLVVLITPNVLDF